MTKTRAFDHKSCQNIPSSLGVTKSRAFDHTSCQNISSTVAVTKTRAFDHKSGQNCPNLLCRKISRASPENYPPFFCFFELGT